jgi:hypothetical protein
LKHFHLNLVSDTQRSIAVKNFDSSDKTPRGIDANSRTTARQRRIIQEGAIAAERISTPKRTTGGSGTAIIPTRDQGAIKGDAPGAAIHKNSKTGS